MGSFPVVPQLQSTAEDPTGLSRDVKASNLEAISFRSFTSSQGLVSPTNSRHSVQLPLDYSKYADAAPITRNDIWELSRGNDDDIKKSATRTLKSLTSEWYIDLLYLVLGAAAMVTLLVLLAYFDQTPLKPFIWGITLNGIISAISFVWKACTATVISNCIGQLKWGWFQKERRLVDMEVFDEASRGGFAVFRLIARTPWITARTAGFIMLLSVTFDPFMQQLVSYPMSISKIASTNVTLIRGVTYTMAAPDQQSIQNDLSVGRGDQNFAFNVVGSALFTRYTQAFENTQLQCPSLNNCSWDVYATLGLCNKCIQLTSADWETNCGIEYSDCSYNFYGGVAQFNIKTPNVDGFSALLFESQEVSPSVSYDRFNLSNPLLTFASLKLRDTDYSSPENATICVFYPCVYTIAGSSVNGQGTIDTLTSWRNESAPFPIEGQDPLPDIYMTPEASDLGLDVEGFNRTTYFIPGPVASLIRVTLRSIVLTRLWSTGPTATHISWNFTSIGYGNSELVALKYIYIGSWYTQIFDTISFAATTYMRTVLENYKYKVTGYIISQFTIINVRWNWIIMPASLYGITVFVFGFTVWATRGLPTWRNSVLPLLFASQLCGETAASGSSGEKELRRHAKEVSLEIETRQTEIQLKKRWTK